MSKGITGMMVWSWLVLVVLGTPAAQAATPDWRLYGELLEQHVSRHTREGIELAWVDYSALKGDARFEQVVHALADFPPEALENREERLAFYINAYNILALKVVLDHWPLASIKDAAPWYASVWKRRAGVLGGRAVSLDEIEHQILRPMREPRIHMAIVCASLSCPDLRREPYRSVDLERQLDDQTRDFLSNVTKGMRQEAGLWRTSKIFDWFAEDFGGRSGVAEFLARHNPAANGLRRDEFKANLPYDWSVNGS